MAVGDERGERGLVGNRRVAIGDGARVGDGVERALRGTMQNPRRSDGNIVLLNVPT